MTCFFVNIYWIGGRDHLQEPSQDSRSGFPINVPLDIAILIPSRDSFIEKHPPFSDATMSFRDLQTDRGMRYAL